MMKKNIPLVAAAAVLVICVIAAVSDSRVRRDIGHNYEFSGDITLPPYQNDIDKLIAAYEGMIDRLIYVTETTGRCNIDMNSIEQKLSSIDRKITALSARLARIENSLGIQSPSKQLYRSEDSVNEANENSKNINGTNTN